MTRSRIVAVSAIYFVVIFALAFFVRDIPNQAAVTTLTIAQLQSGSGLGDPGSFAKAAIDIATNGWVQPENEWILNLWPPGFILLEAGIMKSFGTEAPVLLILQLLASLTYAVLLTLIAGFLSEHMRLRYALTLPLLLFAFPVARVFLLQPTGVSFGETFSIAFFLIHILLSYRALKLRSLKIAATAGVFLALSAYFRSQFEIILLSMTAWTVVAALLSRFKFFKRIDLSGAIVPTIKTIAAVVIVANVATVPWRLYHLIKHQSPAWVHTSSVTFGNSVMTNEHLELKNGGFVVEGGGNLVCRIDPSTCGNLEHAKSLFIKTFLKNPIEWYSLKLDIIGKYWYASVENWTSPVVKASAIDWIVNGFILISIIALWAMLFARKSRQNYLWTLSMWLTLSLTSTYVLIFTVQQFEVRYFYFPKIVGLVMALLASCLYFGRPPERLKS